MEEFMYPTNDGLGHISNLSSVKEIKIIKSDEIKLINELIKKDWIFIYANSNQEILLGRV